MPEAAGVPKKSIDILPMLQDIKADLQRVSKSVAEIKDGFMRTKEYHKVIGTTVGDVTVGAAVRFPDSGQTDSWRDLIRAGKVTHVLVENTGGANMAYLAFNRNATTDEPLVIPPGTGVMFDVQVNDYISICSVSATYTTTVRVALFGE